MALGLKAGGGTSHGLTRSGKPILKSRVRVVSRCPPRGCSRSTRADLSSQFLTNHHLPIERRTRYDHLGLPREYVTPVMACRETTLARHDAYQVAGAWVDGQQPKIVAQKTVVIPQSDGLYLPVEREWVSRPDRHRLDATDIIDAQSTIM